MTTYQLHPIGYVRQDQTGSYLEIEKAYRPALQGLEGFSHLTVVWWAHLTDTPDLRSVCECDKPYRQAPDKLGIFATRSPVRPNPVALSVVTLLKVDQAAGRIWVPYLDAEPGTPIVDLKPYHPCTDRLKAVTVPAWCRHWPQSLEDSAAFDWEAELIYPR